MRINVLDVMEGIEFGGGDRRIVQIAESLDRRRFRLVVACASDGLLAKKIQEAGVEVQDVDMSNKCDLRPIFKLAALMKQRNIHIVHTQGARPSFFGRIAARLAGIPIIITTIQVVIETYNVTWIKKAIYKQLDKLTVGFADKVITVSEPLRRTLITNYGVEPSKVIKIYNGIETERYNPNAYEGAMVKREFGIAQNYSVVGIIARLVYEKAHYLFLQAAARIVENVPDVKFLIVGDGPLKTELEDLARKLGVSQYCLFTGFRDDIPKIISTLDVLVLCSLLEGMPMTILEGMAMAKPVVATNVGGIPELVKDGETGILVPPRDAESLAKAIIALLKDRDKARHMGLFGRRRVEKEFDVEIMVRKTEETYQELI